MTIYIKTSKRTVPIRIDSLVWGSNGHLVVRAEGLHFSLMGNVAEMIVELRGALDRLEERVVTQTEKEMLQDNIRPERFHRIRLEDIPPDDPEKAWPLIVARFPWLADAVPSRYANGKVELPASGDAGPVVVDQLAQDIAAVADLDLLDDEGEPIWGAQSRVAERLGIPNAGGHRQRILEVLAELQDRRAA